MTPRQKQSSNLIMQFLCILFLFLVIYMIINMFSNRAMRCGCAMGCSGSNVSCPCYRNNVMRQSPYSNEYYQPQVGSDFTSYLNQVRQNQLKFSREGFKEGAGNMSSSSVQIMSDPMTLNYPSQIQQNKLNPINKPIVLNQASNKRVISKLKKN